MDSSIRTSWKSCRTVLRGSSVIGKIHNSSSLQKCDQRTDHDRTERTSFSSSWKKSCIWTRETLVKVEPVFKLIASDIRDDDRRTISDVISPAVKTFIDRYLGSAPNTRVFKAIEVIVQEFPELTQGTETIFGLINSAITDIESRRRAGTNADMRWVTFSRLIAILI